MAGRLGRCAGVYTALGLLWWATVHVLWRAMACGDWACLAPSTATLVLVTVAVLAGAAWALDRVGVGPARRVAAVAAGMLLILRLAGEALPSWPATWAHAATAGVAFGVAGAFAALATAPGLAGKWRLATTLGALALIPIAPTVIWIRAPH
ncbi:hypothetical protein [Nonomuraea sp. LPB2021202275-12-8]|uniref:hypothetical protein n=1 Tax=Nonomuraea sp. LPB2021202275-12-8 TaxID=3120159 RepID=UPI00300C7840